MFTFPGKSPEDHARIAAQQALVLLDAKPAPAGQSQGLALIGVQGAVDGGFDLQQVLAGFDQEKVGAALQQALRLFGVVLAESVEIDVAERGEYQR